MTGHYTASYAIVLGWLCWWPDSNGISGALIYSKEKYKSRKYLGFKTVIPEKPDLSSKCLSPLIIIDVLLARAAEKNLSSSGSSHI
jgi:hypothetical protein